VRLGGCRDEHALAGSQSGRGTQQVEGGEAGDRESRRLDVRQPVSSSRLGPGQGGHRQDCERADSSPERALTLRDHEA